MYENLKVCVFACVCVCVVCVRVCVVCVCLNVNAVLSHSLESYMLSVGNQCLMLTSADRNKSDKSKENPPP